MELTFLYHRCHMSNGHLSFVLITFSNIQKQNNSLPVVTKFEPISIISYALIVSQIVPSFESLIARIQYILIIISCVVPCPYYSRIEELCYRIELIPYALQV